MFMRPPQQENRIFSVPSDQPAVYEMGQQRLRRRNGHCYNLELATILCVAPLTFCAAAVQAVAEA